MKTIYQNINNYYTNKVITHGTTPKGVDWNGEESQFIRFAQLSKIISQDNFSINDIGCGYGKYTEYLAQNYNNCIYNGYDLSSEMIENAKQLYPNFNFLTIKKLQEIGQSDYSIASGIFSVKMEHNEAEWLSYILSTIEQMNEKSMKGFSFNMLTKYSDKEYMRDDLYYADPLFIFDYCKRNFSKEVALLHDYGLYEFTILVRKDI
ncbi:MAG: class I SAM-dependent methyltransferase [Arcobacteraceae bacterium]|jgi:SAM-dependent methyltransferase|nr:class I SAM-dependent methyltransferase [Arcobacteraceae bacterium]